MTTKSRSKTLDLHINRGPAGLKNYGTITVDAEETVASKNAVEVAFRCTRLDNKDFFSKSVCFINLSVKYSELEFLVGILSNCKLLIALLLGSIFKNLQDY